MEQKLTDAQRMRALREKRKEEGWLVLDLKMAFPPDSRIAKYAKLAGGAPAIKKGLQSKFEKIEKSLTLMEIADAVVSKFKGKKADGELFRKIAADFLIDCVVFGTTNGASHLYNEIEGEQSEIEKCFGRPLKFVAKIEGMYERLKQKEESS